MDTMILRGNDKVADFAVEMIIPTIGNGRKLTKLQADLQKEAVEFDSQWSDVTSLISVPKKEQMAALATALDENPNMPQRMEKYPGALLKLKQGNLLAEFKFVIDDSKLTPEQKGLLTTAKFWENQNLAEMREFVNSFRTAISGGL